MPLERLGHFTQVAAKQRNGFIKILVIFSLFINYDINYTYILIDLHMF